MEIKEKNAMDAWIKALSTVMSQGSDYLDSDSRPCRELLNLAITVEKEEGVAEPLRRMDSLGKWVYPSEDELVSSLLESGRGSTYEYSYSSRLFRFSGVKNQLDGFIIPLLMNSPSSKRAVVSMLDPEEDSFPDNHAIPELIFVQFRVKEEKLHVTGLLRTNDLFFGFPANLFQLYKLQGYVAKELGFEKGSITALSTSAQVFLEYEADIKSFLAKNS